MHVHALSLDPRDSAWFSTASTAQGTVGTRARLVRCPYFGETCHLDACWLQQTLQAGALSLKPLRLALVWHRQHSAAIVGTGKAV